MQYVYIHRVIQREERGVEGRREGEREGRREGRKVGNESHYTSEYGDGGGLASSIVSQESSDLTLIHVQTQTIHSQRYTFHP